jgi:hypothetical protein
MGAASTDPKGAAHGVILKTSSRYRRYIILLPISTLSTRVRQATRTGAGGCFSDPSARVFEGFPRVTLHTGRFHLLTS